MSFDYKDKSLDNINLSSMYKETLNAMRKHNTSREAAESINCNHNTFRRRLERIRNKQREEPNSNEEVKDINRKLNEHSLEFKDFTEKEEFIMVVTCAQNGTPVHDKFWRNINAYAKILNESTPSKLLVIPIRYRNPTSVFADIDRDYWDPMVMPHICEDDIPLNDNLCVLGSLKTQPTRKRPLNGREQSGGSKSVIIGHTRLHFKPIATPSNRLPKLLMSTGACTIANYTDSSAGYDGTEHHKISAVIIHVKGKKFLPRQIIACEDGSFIDLDIEMKDGKPRKAPRAQCLATGDLHGVNHDPYAVAATKDMARFFAPLNMTYDDSLDFESGSHHNKCDPIHNFKLISQGRNIILNELKGTYKVLDSIIDEAPEDTRAIVKRANHDEHFDRWVKETDPRKDLPNALVWCESFTCMVNDRDPYEMYAEKYLKNYSKTTFLKRDEMFMIGDVNHEGHGDKGSNGARGGIEAFTKLGCPGQWGHSHTPHILDDQYQSGTLSLLRMGYNTGPSSWLHANTVQYGNGKRSLLLIIDGEWRF